MQRIELSARRIIRRDRREVADRGAQRVHARDDRKLRKHCEPKHHADQQVPHSEDIRGAFRDPAVEQRTGQKDDSGNDPDPVQFAQSAPNNIPGKMRVGQNAWSEYGWCQNECEEHQTADPGDEREQHEKAEEGHHGEL